MFKRDAKSRIYSIGMRLQCMDGLCMLPGIDLNIYYICVCGTVSCESRRRRLSPYSYKYYIYLQSKVKNK